MMTTDYVRYAKGDGPSLGQVLRCYVAEDGKHEGEEIAVVAWTDGHTTHTLADALVVVPATAQEGR